MNKRLVVARVLTGVFWGFVLMFLLQFPMNNEAPDVQLYAQAIFFSISAMGLNLLTGFNGQVSLGHGAFFGVGAFTTAVLVSDHGWPILATIPVAAVLALAIGVVVGFPALRVKGLYLALVTLGLAVLFPDIINKYFVEGGQGQITVPRRDRFAPEWWPSNIDAQDQYAFYLSLICAALLLGAAYLIIRSRFGRSLIAVRDHEAAAATVGINPAFAKLGAFGLSAMYAGVAGSLSVLVLGNATANKATTFQQSIFFLVAVVVGGTATVFGPLVGGYFVVMVQDQVAKFVESPDKLGFIPMPGFLEEFFFEKAILSPAIFGITLILMMYVLPDGIVGGVKRLYNWIWNLVERRSRARAASPALN